MGLNEGSCPAGELISNGGARHRVEFSEAGELTSKGAARHYAELNEARNAGGQRGGYSQERFTVDMRSRQPLVETELSTQPRLPTETKLDCMEEALLIDFGEPTNVSAETGPSKPARFPVYFGLDRISDAPFVDIGSEQYLSFDFGVHSKAIEEAVGLSESEEDHHLMDDGFDEEELFTEFSDEEKAPITRQIRRGDQWFDPEFQADPKRAYQDANIRRSLLEKQEEWNQVTAEQPYDRLCNNIDTLAKERIEPVSKEFQWVLDLQNKEMVEGSDRMNFKHFAGQLKKLGYRDLGLIQMLDTAVEVGGFPLDCDRDIKGQFVDRNYKQSYAAEFASSIHESVTKQYESKVLLGPFLPEEVPFDDYWTHPIFAVRKKRHGVVTKKIRVITNSSSETANYGVSLNSIQSLAVPIRLQDTRDAVRRIEELMRNNNPQDGGAVGVVPEGARVLGHDAFDGPEVSSSGPRVRITQAKEDLANAFGQMYIRADDVPFQGFVWFDVRKPLPDHILRGEGLRPDDQLFVYFNCRYVFGTLTSVSHFYRISMAIRFLFLHEGTEDVNGNLVEPVIPGDKYDCSAFFDDFNLISTEFYNPVGSMSGMCSRRFLNVIGLNCIGASVNEDKRDPDAIAEIEKEYLGIELDTETGGRKLSDARVEAGRATLESFLKKKQATVQELMSLNGQLLWASLVCLYGWVFTKRLRELVKKHQYSDRRLLVWLPRGVRIDIQTWWNHWSKWNGVSYTPKLKWCSMRSIGMRTDSSFTGYGGINIRRKEYFYGKWSSWAALELDISPLEFVIIIMAVEVWWQDFARESIVFEADNESCVSSINSLKAQAGSMIVGVRTMTVLANKISTRMAAIHRVSEDNICADSASRDFDEDTFWAEATKYHPKSEWRCIEINEDLLNKVLVRMRRANGRNTRPEN
jgi:hypothetical protein